MGKIALIDTNAVIDYLEGKLPKNGIAFIEKSLNNKEAILSVIVKIELLSFNPPNPNDLTIINTFIDQCTILPLSEPIVDKTILLRRNYRTKLPDMIIAATALIHNINLITRNENDFKNIANLVVINPYNL